MSTPPKYERIEYSSTPPDSNTPTKSHVDTPFHYGATVAAWKRPRFGSSFGETQSVPMSTSSPCKLKRRRLNPDPRPSPLKSANHPCTASANYDNRWFVTSSQSNHFLETSENEDQTKSDIVDEFLEHADAMTEAIPTSKEELGDYLPMSLSLPLLEAALESIEDEYIEEDNAIEQELRELDRIRNKLSDGSKNYEMREFFDSVSLSINKEIRNYKNLQRKWKPKFS